MENTERDLSSSGFDGAAELLVASATDHVTRRIKKETLPAAAK
jgi:hypothetical protein